ncbi:peptidoglycan-associated lipoprotein Pal [Phenylobacterium sp.]|jgi:peptidoglycan-associated lipoprotein|uniref:peptidoglycan-associated lipoprotein Pal n=1 Tax=Phenylobacterium sp. TaxID=1871053 RepID=UPI002E37FD55|nr:peptidoglycan-associated lipoprotein Pal [Phenylobacterium sp.]HEX2561182.1 peptidoglycan-associated lipoprotein Pal [Phenylobacterium sp.]
MTSLSTPRVLRLALIVAATASMAACASKPKPQPTGPTGPAPGAQGPESPVIPGQPGDVGQAATPGSEQDFVINVGDRVYFDFDSYEVRADAGPVLDAQSAWLNRYPAVRVRIEGNADERGTREYNLALGARRANSVRDYLVSRGVSASRITTISYGKEQPIDPGTSEESYQRNRNARTAITGGAR